MNRGSKPGGLLAAETTPGFNEAPIHESGKWVRDGDHERRGTGRFNEAPIHESGKWYEVKGFTTLLQALQ